MNISEFLNTINSANTTKYQISKNPRLEIQELRELENKFSIKLPKDLVEFYTASNGLEGDDYIFKILPFSKIEKDRDDLGIYIVFSEYMIFSETCGLEIDEIDGNKYRIFNTSSYSIENGIIKRKYVADTLVDFIKLYSMKGTFGIWGDETEDSEETKETNINDEDKNIDESNKLNEFVTLEKKNSWWKFW